MPQSRIGITRRLPGLPLAAGFERLAELVRGVKFVDGVRQEKQNQVKPRLQQVAA
jgi:hypothetical protein